MSVASQRHRLILHIVPGTEESESDTLVDLGGYGVELESEALGFRSRRPGRWALLAWFDHRDDAEAAVTWLLARDPGCCPALVEDGDGPR